MNNIKILTLVSRVAIIIFVLLAIINMIGTLWMIGEGLPLPLGIIGLLAHAMIVALAISFWGPEK